MDEVQAQIFSKSLEGISIAGWLIGDFLGAGKSAVVHACAQNGIEAAIKVFHPELVEKYGRAPQLERIKRECSLIGASHPHLVKIIAGGESEPGSGFLYVVMERLPHLNLAQRLLDIDAADHRTLIGQLADAAFFLEERGLVHRDIKPENIAVSNDGKRLILMDLGVLRPFGESNLTDIHQRPFIGTLRYSSPEFLLRLEDQNNVEGWRAITFYQIGAVLHDLLMGKQLFDEFTEPYARLVQAVLTETPRIFGSDVVLVNLAKSCLIKDPKDRCRAVNWNSFAFNDEVIEKSLRNLDFIKNRQRGVDKRLEGAGLILSEKRRIERLNIESMYNRIESKIALIIHGADCFPLKSITPIKSERYEIAGCNLFFEKDPGLDLPLHMSMTILIETISIESEKPLFKIKMAASIMPAPDSQPDTAYRDVCISSPEDLDALSFLEAALLSVLRCTYLYGDRHGFDQVKERIDIDWTEELK